MDDEIQELPYGEKPAASDMIIDIPPNEPEVVEDRSKEDIDETVEVRRSGSPEPPSADTPQFPLPIPVETFAQKSTDHQQEPIPVQAPLDEKTDEPPKTIETISDVVSVSEPEPVPRTHMSVDSENGFEKLDVDEAKEPPRIENPGPTVVISPEPRQLDVEPPKVPVVEKSNAPKDPSKKGSKCGFAALLENRHFLPGAAIVGAVALLLVVYAAKKH